MTIKNQTTNNTHMTSQRGNNVGCLSCRSEHLQYCFNTSTTLQNSVARFVSDSWASCKLLVMYFFCRQMYLFVNL